MNKLIQAITIVSFFLLFGCDQIAPTASISFVVVDENGAPIDDAEVKVNYFQKGIDGTKIHIEDGVTNIKGEVSSSGKTVGLVRYSVKKPGYYRSSGSYDYLKRNGFSWEPENPLVKVVLREVKNPVPMYARDTGKSKLEIPALDTDIGFDLTEYDWITPYGQGKYADFVFNLHREVENESNYVDRLTINFSNTNDGIIQFRTDDSISSGFKYPYLAPDSGYTNLWVVERVVKDGVIQNYSFDKNNYFFRIRSELKDGNYYRSVYGKIHGDIKVSRKGTDTGNIGFRYFLNPDYTRNIEYDVMRNLFVGLDRREMVVR